MSSLVHNRRPLALRALAIFAIAATLLTTVLADTASAHGSAIDPPARNYSCLDRWGDNHQAPEMATEDPMCHQAWQANPNAMWNWNGLYRSNVGGNHQAAIPDGTLCSGGQTEGGRYNAMDAIGAWHAVEKNTNFSVRIFDQASHGADYIRVYVTRQGFNALTEPLGWSDLEQIGEMGDRPASTWEPVEGGVEISVPANAAGRTGRHIVYTIWQASHLDQPYYWCSDVIFPGGSPDPEIPPTTPVTPTPPVADTGCSAVYSVISSWTGGFQAEVRVTAGASEIVDWQVDLNYAGTQAIQSSWNATLTTNGSTVTARSSGNGDLGPGASTTFGFIGTTNSPPTVSCTAS